MYSQKFCSFSLKRIKKKLKQGVFLLVLLSNDLNKFIFTLCVICLVFVAIYFDRD